MIEVAVDTKKATMELVINVIDSMNKIEVTFPSADPSYQLSGDLTLPLDGGDETKLLPAIVIVAGSGVSYVLAEIILMHMFILFYARGCIILLTDLDTSCHPSMQIIKSR